MPDPNFPLLLTPNKFNKLESSTLELRFKLPTRVKDDGVSIVTAGGLYYGQFFGVRFQNGVFSFTSNRPTCQVSTASTPVIASTSIQSENTGFNNGSVDVNTIYCQILDTNTPNLVPGETITLKLIFGIAISTKYINDIHLFTTTSNKLDGLLIDNTPGFGSIGLYNDYTNSVNRQLVVFEKPTDFLNISGGGQILRPFNTFDMKVAFIVNDQAYKYSMNPNDYTFVFLYSTTNFSNPTSITTTEYGNILESDKNASGNLTFTEITKQGIIINGLTKNDLTLGRRFYISLNGMKTTDKSLSVNTHLTLIVYYKNTYNIVSYYRENIGRVEPAVIMNMKAYHPEKMYMFDGWGWPFVFEFSVGTDLTSGGFVLIRNSIYDVKSRSVNLVASSCDLSENTVDQDFGKRANCYPLRNDFNWTGDPSGDSSGVFFKLVSITKNTVYKLKVWGFIDICKGDTASENFAQSLYFSISIYYTAPPNNTSLNETRFPSSSTSTNWKIAVPDNNQKFLIEKGCWPLQTRTLMIAANTNLNANFNKLPNETNINLIRGTNSSQSFPIGLEITNIGLLKEASDTNMALYATTSDTFLSTYDNNGLMTYNTNVYVQKYLYDTSASDLPNSNLFFYGVFQGDITASTQLIHSFYPSECHSFATTNFHSNVVKLPRIQFLFSRQFLVESVSLTTGCTVGWKVPLTVIAGADTTQRSVLTLKNGITTVNPNLSQTSTNQIRTLMTSIDISITSSTGFKIIQDKNIVTTNSELTSISSTGTSAYKISSQVQPTYSNTADFLSMIGVGLDCDSTVTSNAGTLVLNSFNMAIYTNCLKWDSIPNTVKSINSYFEVQKVLLHDNKYPLKIIRYIKLFPEIGVFQSPTNTDKLDDTRKISTNADYQQEKWIQAHYTVTDKNSSPFAVCILEISGFLLEKKKGTSSNMLIIWLLNVSLLDLDPENLVSEYPLAPVTSGVAYGINSGQTLSLGNRLISDPNGTPASNIYPQGNTTVTNLSINHNALSFFEYYYLKNIVRLAWGGVFGASISTNYNFKRSYYYPYLSSVIYIKTSQNPTGSVDTNLVIPYLCPSAIDYSDIATSYTSTSNNYFVAPIVTVAWAQMDKYNSVSKIDSYISGFNPQSATLIGKDIELYTAVGDLTDYAVVAGGTARYPPIHTILLKPQKNANGTTMLIANKKTVNSTYTQDRSGNILHLKNQFIKYNSTTESKSYLIKNTSGTAGYFSAISIFANQNVASLDTVVSHDIVQSKSTGNKFRTKTLADNNFVYLLGKKFNKFLGFTFAPLNASTAGFMSAVLDPATVVSTDYGFSFAKDTVYTITGISRIAIEKYNGTTTIDPLNFIAIFTSTYLEEDSSSQVNKTFTNLSVSSNLFSDFVLYFPAVDNSSWSAVMSRDTDYTDLDINNAANLKITGTIPSTVPSGAQIVLTMASGVLSSTSGNSLCGLVENGTSKIPTLCSISSSVITCQLSKPSNTFYVCCYNTIDNNSTSINAVSASLVLPYNTTYITSNVINTFNPTANAADKFDNTLYKFPLLTTSNFAEYKVTRTNVKSVSSSTFFARVTELVYSLSSTHLGLGAVYLKVDLSQSAQRGMTITINSNFSAMRIPNVRTRIVPTFSTSNLYGSTFENGDLFVDTIYTTLSDSSSIQIKLKNMLYKCTLSLASSFRVFMWPVKTVNYLTHNIISVNVKSVDGTSMSADTSHTLSSSPALNTDISVNTIQENVLSITKIDPLVIGEYANYSFKFNLNTLGAGLEGKVANEILIFAPFYYYGQNTMIDCYGEDFIKLECAYVNGSSISIKLANSITIAAETVVVFHISGFRNPNLAEALYWVASLNETDFYEETRKCLFVATTSLSDGIQNVSDSTFGQIIFKNGLSRHSFTILSSNTNESNYNLEVGDEQFLNPREIPELQRDEYRSYHQFTFTLDVANEALMIDNSYIYNDSPVLYITFPSNYKFYWYSFTPISKFSIYNIDEDGEIYEFSVLNQKSISIFGNKIKIEFEETSFELTKTFQYFGLDLFNIPSPPDSTLVGEVVTTEAFEILLTTQDYKKVFKTYSNSNNFSNLDVLGTKISPLLEKNKGLKYEFDSYKFIIDSVDKSSSSQKINAFTVYGGRFAEYNFKVRSTQKLLKPSKTDIKINNSIIFFDKPFYTVASALNSDIKFSIGASCSVQSGWEIVNPTFENSSTSNVYDSFLPISPWIVYIASNKDNLGVISFIENNIVKEVGSLFVDFEVDFPPFEDLTINFSGSEFSQISPAVIKKGQHSVRTVFSIIKQGGIGDPSFQLSKPSSKCFEYKYNTINFKVDGIMAIIPNSAMKREEFTYKNSNDDNTLNKNSIKFIFNTEYNQIYLYAVLTCLNDAFPSDEDMKNQQINESNRLGYFSESLNIFGKAELVFNNLIRGQAYKLKVIIESTQGDKSFRTSSKIEIFNQTLSDGKVIDIKASDSQSPLCASYRFNTRPGIHVTDRLLWFWQNRFSLSGYYEGGCITAVDQYGTNIPGLPDVKKEESCGRSNCRFIDYKNYTYNNTNNVESETYTICAYPLSSCAIDPSNFDEIYNNILSELNNNVTFVEKLNVEVAPEFVVSQVKDNTAPIVSKATDIKYSDRKVTFTMTTSTSTLCYIIPAKSAPTSGTIENCKENCSTFNFSSKSELYSISLSINDAGTYNLYGICFNDMPCSTQKTGILDLGSFTISSSNTSSNNGSNTNTTKPDDSKTSESTNSEANFSSYLFTSILGLILSVLLMI